MCDEYRGAKCDVTELCGNNRTSWLDCDLFGISRYHWSVGGNLTIKGDTSDSPYGNSGSLLRSHEFVSTMPFIFQRTQTARGTQNVQPEQSKDFLPATKQYVFLYPITCVR